MTALVTGAAGFLGSHVADLLAESGERPRLLIRPGEDASRLVGVDGDVIEADITDRAALGAFLRGVDRVINCAARTGPWGPEAEYECTNVRGLEALARAARATGVRRFVHVSSATVHGIDVNGAADESAPLRDEPNPYSRSKVAGERLLDRMVRDDAAPITIVRPGWIYGPRDTGSFGRVARTIDEGKMVMAGSGQNHLPLIYARDAARGILLASRADVEPGRCYLLVNDERVTQRDFLNAIAAGLNAAPPTRRIPYRLGLTLGACAESLWRLLRRETPPPVTRFGLRLLGGENRFDISRARRELGFSPQVDIAQGVMQSVAWYREAHAPLGTAIYDRGVDRTMKGARA
jgi:nucleoside-diphosphate-sugar epimerase